MIDRNLVYAVVGASNNTEKYGYKVFKDLKEGGYKVVAINPNETNPILDTQPYATLESYKGKIDVVVCIVPPKVTEKIVEEAKKLGIKNIWMQPGAESENAITFCQQNNIACIAHSCIMIERKK